MNKRQRAILGIVVRVVLFGGLLAAAYAVDVESLKEVASKLSIGPVVWFIALCAVERLLAVTRWWTVCGLIFGRFDYVSPLFLVRTQLVAEFVNLWVPSFVGGEVGRVVYLRRYAPSLTQAVATVAVDRIIGLGGVCLTALPFGWVLYQQVQAFQLPWWMALVVGAVGLVGAAGAVVLWRSRRAQVEQGVAQLRSVQLRPLPLLGVAVLMIATAAMIVPAYMPFFASVHPTSVWTIATIVLFSRFGRLVPVHLLGVNSVDGLVVLLGELHGVPTEVLALMVALSVLQRVVFSLSGGAVELAISGRDFLTQLRGGSVSTEVEAS